LFAIIFPFAEFFVGLFCEALLRDPLGQAAVKPAASIARPPDWLPGIVHAKCARKRLAEAPGAQ